MGGKPKTIYSDNEGSFNSRIVKHYLEEEGIHQIITLGHAAYAERQIRTIKDMIYKRLEDDETKKWLDVLYPVLLTYNAKRIHKTTNLTPQQARKPENHLRVKLQLEIHRVKKRKYEEVKVGDKVRLYEKKKTWQKERIGVWSHEIYTIERIDTFNGQQFYKLDGRLKACLRNEILKVS